MAEPLSFPVHLSRQLGFIGRSAFLYDWGSEEEAIRIAVSIRTLMRNSSRSSQKSLLTHLGHPEVKLLTTVEPCSFPPPTTTGHQRFWDGVVTSRWHRGFKPASEWFKQPILVSNDNWITRENIVDGAADTDGGAHIDSKLKGNYPVVNEAMTQFAEIQPDGTWGMLEDDVSFHFAALRNMAFELLNSPDLLALCDWNQADAWPQGSFPMSREDSQGRIVSIKFERDQEWET